MKKVLNEELSLFFYPTFPKCFLKQTRNNRVLLGIGGNIGNSVRRFKKLALLFAKHPVLRLIETAPILKNPPFGYKEQPDFYNTLFVVDTTLSPFALLHYILYIEKRFKRVRSFKNAPRTLDIDIIWYEDKKVQTKNLIIPHPKWQSRDAVVIPLKYMLERR